MNTTKQKAVAPTKNEPPPIKRRYKDMRRTGLRFTWSKGSQNDNAIKIFKANNINFEYNHFGALTADFYGIGIFEKVDFQHLENDDFEICIA